jgi:hypothetical protein
LKTLVKFKAVLVFTEALCHCLPLDKSVDGRIRYKKEHQINLANSQYTTTKTYLSKMKLPYVGVHNLVPK